MHQVQGTSALRIVPADGRLSAESTLSEFYYAYWRGVLEKQGKAPRTLDQYDQSIGLWAKYAKGVVDAAGRVHAAAEPPLAAIGDDVLSFAYALARLPSIGSDNTIRKHVTHVQAVLDRTGPKTRERRLRLAKGLLDEVPLIEKPPEFEHEVDDDYELAEIGQILAACRTASVPTYLPAELRPRWWRNLITVTCNMGQRIGSVMSGRWDGLAERQGGWHLTVKLKGRKKKPKRVNRFAAAAIEDQRELTGNHAFIFHWPHYTRDGRLNLTWLSRSHAAIVATSGLPPARRFGFHGYRKWFSTTASAHDALGAALQADHSHDVMVKNYLGRARVAQAVDELPQPVIPETRQLELF